MSIGFRIRARARAVDPEIVAAFRGIPVANVGDVMGRMNGAGPRLRPIHAGAPLAGPAFTVKTRPGDNLMIHKALALAEPGDVIVVDGGGDLTAALIGDLMLAQGVAAGIAGFVIDGAIRDSATIRGQDLPVFAAGISHRGPFKDGPGEINVPIVLGRMSVEPGDLILGDADGVLCVPFGEAAEVAAAARAKQSAEDTMLRQIQDGSYDRAWIDATLARLGCEMGG